MGIRFNAARAVASATSWGLRNVFRRDAGNFPGKLALYLDGDLIANLRPRCAKGSVLVVGTNGKTTVTNLLADCLQAAGQRVICNRGGANLASGIATSLLAADTGTVGSAGAGRAGAGAGAAGTGAPADWGVFEVDELWLAKVAPGLQPSYVLLLNLFRDQLDRMGETDTIQKSICAGLAASPGTILVYNADDPNCAAIARAVPNKSVAFGIEGSLGLPQPNCAAAQMCAECAGVLDYAFRQYDQLGDYACPSCGFSRPTLDYAACSTSLNAGGIGMDIGGRHVADSPLHDLRLHARWTGAYMVYNLLAIATAALMAGCSLSNVQDAVDAFDPRNGRLQWTRAQGRDVLLNLAKNPTGFNQNLQIVLGDEAPCAAAFFVNDAEGDGRDTSWIWNVDFELLAARPDIVVFAGGTRALELQLRMKYAGVACRIVQNAADVLDAVRGGAGAGLPADARIYVIANYTALPPLRAELAKLEDDRAKATGSAKPPVQASAVAADADAAPSAATGPAGTEAEAPVVIVQMFPDLLGVFGDGGNVRVLAQRLAWRGIPCELRELRYGDALDIDDADLVHIGGSMGRELTAAAQALSPQSRKLQQFAQRGGVIFGISGGFQMLGQTWTMDGKTVPCLGLVEMETRERAGDARALGDVALDSPLANTPVVGFANHAGTACAKPSIRPFGTVIASNGSVSGAASGATGSAAGSAKPGGAERFGRTQAEAACADEQSSKPANLKDREHGAEGAGAKAGAVADRGATGPRDGAIAGNVMGTYLHGPVLAKNPELADELLRRALAHRASRTGVPAPALAPLDDAAEQAANAFIRTRLHA